MVELFKNDEVLLDQLAKSKAEFREELGWLQERIDFDIELSEIGEFDNNGIFHIQEKIKWKDDKWNYIEVRWKRFYEYLWNEEWLWYSISTNRADNSNIVYLWNMNWTLSNGYGIEYLTGGRKFMGKWENGVKIHGNQILSDWRSFYWNYDVSNRKMEWTLRKYQESWENYWYIYEWELDWNFNKEWQWTITYDDWDKYEWERNKWKKHWHGIYSYGDWRTYDWEWINDEKQWQWTMTYKNWDKYEWQRINNKREWQWTMTYNNWNKYEWKWIDDKKEWQWTMTYNNWDKYEWEWIDDKRHCWKYFYKNKNDYYEWDFIDDKPLLELKHWESIQDKKEWYYKYKDGSTHSVIINSWKIDEITESNNFVFLYGNKANDKKPWESWAKYRWPIKYEKKGKNDQTEYGLRSWGTHTERILENGIFKFKNLNHELKIKEGTKFNGEKFGERDAQHIANLLNFFKNKKEVNGYDWFASWSAYSILWYKNSLFWCKRDLNITPSNNGDGLDYKLNLLNDVPDHFFWISALDVAKFLNDDKFNKHYGSKL